MGGGELGGGGGTRRIGWAGVRLAGMGVGEGGFAE